MTTDTWKRDRPLVKANQELAAAASLIRSAIVKCAKDRRAAGVRLEAALSAVLDAKADVREALGAPAR